MELTKEIFESCVSELRKTHDHVHSGQGVVEKNLEVLNSGGKIGCPICDTASVIMRSREISESFEFVNHLMLGSQITGLVKLLGLEVPIMASQAGILALGVMIGKKLAEVEQVERLR
jgi:hypothetical protein